MKTDKYRLAKLRKRDYAQTDMEMKKLISIKNPANIITSLRFLFAAAMLLTTPFSAAFWLCYLAGGLSDIVDGIVARRLKLQSEGGAKLDSIADLAFASAIAVVVIIHIAIPAWLWLFAAFIAALRFISYGIGYKKYRTFASLHTYANKATGALIFAFPLLYTLVGMTAAGLLLALIGLISSLEELLITVKSSELNRERKSLLID